MKNALIGIGVTTAAVALAVTLVSAHAGGGADRRGGLDQQVGQQGRGGRGGPIGRFGGGLNLTEEQHEKVSTIQRAAREQSRAAEAGLRAAQRDLHRELFADARDAAKVADLSAEIAARQKELADLHVATTTSLSDVLSAAQRAIVRERERRGGPGRGGPGPGFGRFGAPPNRR